MIVINFPRHLVSLCIASLLILPVSSYARDYIIDTRGMHASIQFRIKHLGFSWLTGRFEDFDGRFSYNKRELDTSKIEITVQTASIDTNHAERDKRLRDKKFLDAKIYPEATFISHSFTPLSKGLFLLTGDLNLHGVTREISMQVQHIGEGRDPWGKFRRGFEGTFEITLADYGITEFLGKDARTMELIINLEGIRQ
jgi:polyisoprenoid-binding protein YceI